jgi:hypothetical protein
MCSNGVFHRFIIKLAQRCQQGVNKFNEYDNLNASDLVLAENKVGAHLMVTGTNNHHLQYNNIFIFNKIRSDCDPCYAISNGLTYN